MPQVGFPVLWGELHAPLVPHNSAGKFDNGLPRGANVITSKPAIHDHLKSGQRNSLRRQDSGPDDPCPGGGKKIRP